ncbi:MAG: hypothetical protein QXI10_00740 [Candidatus Diapherotrites archaeon]
MTQGELKLPKKTITISDYADLTTSQSQAQMTSPSSSGLGDFFSAVSESASSSTTSLSNQDIEMKGIKNKIEDIEYKIDNLTKKLHDLLDRFEVVERRVTFRRENG